MTGTLQLAYWFYWCFSISHLSARELGQNNNNNIEVNLQCQSLTAYSLGHDERADLAAEGFAQVEAKLAGHFWENVYCISKPM